MSERQDPRPRRGTPARWSVVALVAPAAAGVFGVATGWAADHQPVTSGSPKATAQPGAGQSGDAEAAAELATLEQQLRTLRSQVDALAGSAPSPTTAAGAPAPAVSKSIVPKSVPRKPIAPKPVVTAPAPAPPVHTTTGGS